MTFTKFTLTVCFLSKHFEPLKGLFSDFQKVQFYNKLLDGDPNSRRLHQQFPHITGRSWAHLTQSEPKRPFKIEESDEIWSSYDRGTETFETWDLECSECQKWRPNRGWRLIDKQRLNGGWSLIKKIPLKLWRKKVMNFVVGGSTGLVVIRDDSCSRGRGFDSRDRILLMDMTFFTLICCKHCIVCLKRPCRCFNLTCYTTTTVVAASVTRFGVIPPHWPIL